MKDKYLVLLHKIAPFSKLKQILVWFKLKHRLKLGWFYRVNNYIKALGVIFIATLLTLTTITSRADIVVLEANKAGWGAIINDNKELIIDAVNPMIVDKKEVCVLWVKNGDTITMLSKLQEYGQKTIPLNEELIRTIKDSEILISIESKNNITIPVKTEYKGVVK